MTSGQHGAAAASIAAAIPDERRQADSAAFLHAPSARDTERPAHVNAAPPNRPIRVVIADDNPLVPVGLRSLLEDDNRVVVVGEARSGGHALLVTRRLQPDVVLLDVPMATHDALPALPALVRLTRVLVLTYSRDPALVAQAMRRGAAGYVVHAEYTTAKLVAAILDAHAGRRHLSPWAAGSLPATEAPATTSRSASRCRNGTQRLRFRPYDALPLASRPHDGQAMSTPAFPRSVQEPQTRLTPPSRRTPPGQ
ncbi:response regulator transcription factor [Pseudonocardia sp.]|jgi:DNA-binding NarL/FixJ family response regulator|uniref:response regulator n=1 Tax=Pseudonocardia sp. TaxID=60912 RepID=UPI0031FDB489